MELTQGVKMLFGVFFVFTICYVSRSIYDVTVEPNTNFPNLFSGMILPVFWDFMPISMMFAYHFKNMRDYEQE